MTPLAQLPEALRDRIISEARKLVGTPFDHQGRVPGVALDCVGELVCVGRACGLMVADETTYPRETDGAALHRCLEAACVPVPQEQIDRADVVIFLRGRSRWHGGVVTKIDPLTMVHAWGRFTASKVREEVVDDEWLARLHGVWRYRLAEKGAA